MSRLRASRDFFARDPIAMAKLLIGQRLVRILDDGTRLAGTIVETEAYLGIKDAAAHSFEGRRTARNEAMYQAPGTLYVYFTYGMHYCSNIVCGDEGEPVAVLLRAIEPTEGLERMRELRAARRRKAGGNGRDGVTAGASASAGRMPRPEAARMPAPQGIKDRELCSGPARLCQAMAIEREHNLIDLTSDSRLWIEVLRPRMPRPSELGNTSRVGVGYAGPWAVKRLRWFLTSSIHVSRSTPC